MNIDEHLIRDLPAPESARRFLDQLAEKHPAESAKLHKNEALLSDVLTLVTFSPLLATTLLQHPEYFWWLDRKRRESDVRGKDELLESLARFSLTNSQLEPQVLFARFRRRELLRIYLRDIRRLATIAEITEEISNLADAILDSALKLARREMDNRFGRPQEADEKGRSITARFCIVALGKLGSRELNYSSDIDLLFLYSNEGNTSGNGTRGAVTNREYFIKLAEFIAKLVGHQVGEGAAYRVDLRLRPHGTLGALAMSVNDTIRYYKKESRGWERQVMIRSRGCAGDIELFREFFASVEDLVFSQDETVQTALDNVRLSKEKIDLENINRRGFDVKLGRGGIREIEFLAQALQLAYGGRDRWLRSSHTLISLARLADRKYVRGSELSELASAYEFLRRTEHILQMEHGVQTHTVPDDPEKRELLARRMTFAGGGDFERDLRRHTANVSRVFTRIFGEIDPSTVPDVETSEIPNAGERSRSHVLASIEKSNVAFAATGHNISVLDRLTSVSPHFAALLAANPQLAAELPDPEVVFVEPDYAQAMMDAARSRSDLGQRLAAVRRVWSRFMLEIVIRDVFERLTIRQAKTLQTRLAEASIAAGMHIVHDELKAKFKIGVDGPGLAVLALGKLGGRGMDYDSDLDLILVYDDAEPLSANVTPAEFYGRAVELFVNAVSSMTRDGNLYRVDLRLRPYGSKGPNSISSNAFMAYIADAAAIWELLAFVKLRAVDGDLKLGEMVENETRRIIHERASTIERDKLSEETRRVRDSLEKLRARSRRGSDIDIKYGSGGMLDVYFAMRYLQLRDNVPDDKDDRSTPFMLERLHKSGSLSDEIYREMLASYEFLSGLDHNLRLTVGRTTRVPLSNLRALQTIAGRMGLTSPARLIEHLTLHRLAIRHAFDQILT